MTKIFAIILTFAILFQSFSLEIEDFNKFPTLIDHISCHLKSGDSFADFITLHYGSDFNNHEQEHKEHKELPFKHQHADAHYHIVYIICNNNYAIKNSAVIDISKNFTYNEPSTNLYVNNFFQPPQRLHS